LAAREMKCDGSDVRLYSQSGADYKKRLHSCA
jgi:hypothetical protein